MTDPAIRPATDADWPRIWPFFDVGRRLAEHVVDWHQARGYAGIQFNAVVETNTAAVRLWESLGFGFIGTVPGAFRSRAHGPVGLHVMFLPLSPALRTPGGSPPGSPGTAPRPPAG